MRNSNSVTISIAILSFIIFTSMAESIIPIPQQQKSNYTLHLLSQDNGAACLDGGPTGLYVHEGAQPKKFMIYFDSGGFCGAGSLSQTLQSCYKRSFTSLGSTANAKQSENFNNKGVLSTLQQKNPLFYNWTKVFMIYCDGSQYQGSRQYPISYKDRKLHFRGASNVLQQYKFLSEKFNLYNAQKIVITGVSSGGIATYLWSNYVLERAQHSKVYSIPDSGLFLTDYYSPLAKQKIVRERSKALLQMISDHSTFPIPQCLKEFDNDILSCFNAANVAKYIKTKMLIVESLYDAWSMKSLLGVQCLENNKPPFSLMHCSDAEAKAMQEYRIASLQAINQMIKSKPHTGAWSPSCVQHGFSDMSSLTNVDHYKVPSDTGKSLLQSITQFMQNPENPPIDIDSIKWPSNKGCNGLQPVTMLKLNVE